MHKSGKSVNLYAAVGMGIGSMIGAGIFALLGESGAIAGNASYISFILGGVIALLSGYSLGKLGARFPAAGGIVEYLGQAFGVGLFSGAMSIMMYIAAVVSIALVAKAFGSYAFSLLPAGYPELLKSGFSVSIVLVFVAVNLNGARDMAKAENIIVMIKLIVLIAFAVTGLAFIHPERLSIATYPPINNVFYSLAVTFFAYEGFRVITNVAEDIENPRKAIPRAIMISIVLVMVLYVITAITVFGNLSVEEVVQSKDFALAEAARPIFGQVGFNIIAVAALIATASSINASLYAVTNVSYQLARHGQLPHVFGRPIRHSREGLLISAFLISLIAAFMDLGEIAVLGSISILLVHFMTHVGHLKLLKKTGASLVLILAACLTNLAAVLLALDYEQERSPHVLILIGAFFIISFGLEIVLRLFMSKKLRLRLKHKHKKMS